MCGSNSLDNGDDGVGPVECPADVFRLLHLGVVEEPLDLDVLHLHLLLQPALHLEALPLLLDQALQEGGDLRGLHLPLLLSLLLLFLHHLLLFLFGLGVVLLLGLKAHPDLIHAKVKSLHFSIGFSQLRLSISFFIFIKTISFQ